MYVYQLYIWKWRFTITLCFMNPCCFTAIKTGRYTHKKKTENIREVKQLERGHQPVIGPAPSHDTGAIVPKLPLWITENKHEIVIDYIVSAFEDQEQTLQVVNIFENIKDIEETFLASFILFLQFSINSRMTHRKSN